VDAGGYLWTNGIPVGGGGGYRLDVQVQMVNLTQAEVTAFVQPLLQTLNELGIPVVIGTPSTRVWSDMGAPTALRPGAFRFGSRLYPRSSFEDPELFEASMAAARATMEDGYVYHGLNLAATDKVAGSLPQAGVHPVWRDTVMHVDVLDPQNLSRVSPAEAMAGWRRLWAHMDAIRAATPGGGAYFNEADLLEQDWQHAFWGSNYERLLKIKKARDPGSVFWAAATVGSEGWAVQTPNELPSQNGRLCRVPV